MGILEIIVIIVFIIILIILAIIFLPRLIGHDRKTVITIKDGTATIPSKITPTVKIQKDANAMNKDMYNDIVSQLHCTINSVNDLTSFYDEVSTVQSVRVSIDSTTLSVIESESKTALSKISPNLSPEEVLSVLKSLASSFPSTDNVIMYTGKLTKQSVVDSMHTKQAGQQLWTALNKAHNIDQCIGDLLAIVHPFWVSRGKLFNKTFQDIYKSAYANIII